MKKMKIIFLGTPDFAVPSLKALHESGHHIIAAVAQPDRARNRRGQLVPTPVHAEAEALGIPFFSFERIGDNAEFLRSLAPDLMVTAAYGQILTQQVLDVPAHGVINVHASLLPKYRGSSPIQWAIADGLKQTGVTIMQTERGLDCGDILRRAVTPIGEKETAGELSARLAELGAKELVETVDEIACGKCVPVKQNESEATYCKKIVKSDGLLDFSRPADELYNKVRAFNPWPVAYTGIGGEMLKIYSCSVTNRSGVPGVLTRNGKELYVACGERSLRLEVLQLPGKRAMSAAEFLAGHPADGLKLEAPADNS